MCAAIYGAVCTHRGHDDRTLSSVHKGNGFFMTRRRAQAKGKVGNRQTLYKRPPCYVYNNRRVCAEGKLAKTAAADITRAQPIIAEVFIIFDDEQENRPPAPL